MFQLAKVGYSGATHYVLKNKACDTQLKQMRKEVADLLRANKQENARIRVETVIRENLTLQVCLLRDFLRSKLMYVRDCRSNCTLQGCLGVVAARSPVLLQVGASVLRPTQSSAHPPGCEALRHCTCCMLKQVFCAGI